jgi:hypothetical protein
MPALRKTTAGAASSTPTKGENGSQVTNYESRVTGHSTLRAAADGDPLEETLHAGAFAPHQSEEFAGVEVGGFSAEEGFEAPLDVGGGPGAEAVALRDDPVVAEGVRHLQECVGRRELDAATCRAGGRIGAGATELEAIKLGAMSKR